MNIHFYSNAQEYTGGLATVETGTCPDVRSLIDDLGDRFGTGFKQVLLDSGSFFFLVNGTGIMQTGGFATKLSPGDKIEILPFFDAG